VTERPEHTAQGYRRFRCRACGKQFNERSGTLLNRTQYPSDVIALLVLWRLRYTEVFIFEARSGLIRFSNFAIGFFDYWTRMGSRLSSLKAASWRGVGLE
jgi:hypothetical protein